MVRNPIMISTFSKQNANHLIIVDEIRIYLEQSKRAKDFSLTFYFYFILYGHV